MQTGQAVLTDPATVWTPLTQRWTDGTQKHLQTATDTALWYHPGQPTVAPRWLPLRDPRGHRAPQALLYTSLDWSPAAMLTAYLQHWQVEAAFQKVRTHLGIDTNPLEWYHFDLVVLAKGRWAMGRQTVIEWAAEDTAAALHAAYRAECEPEMRLRLHALWRVRRGETPTATAAAVGADRTRVQRWLRWYREGGLAAVRAHRRGGPGQSSFLTQAQEQLVVAEAAKGVLGTAQAVRDGIEEPFGVVYAVGSLYTLRPRLGLRRKVPRPQHPQADPQAQATWQKGGSRPA